MNIHGKKIWFIAHKSEFGGAERCLLEMIEVMCDLGAACEVIVPGKGPFTDKLQNRQINYKEVHYRWWVSLNNSSLRRYARKVINYLASLRIMRILKDTSADLVITNTITTPVGAMAAERLDLPHLWVIQEFGEEDHGLIFDDGIYRASLKMEKWTDAFFVNSHAVMEKYREWLPEEKLNLLYYFFSAPKINVSKSNDIKGRFAIVGAIQPGKGQLLAVEAISRLNDCGIKATLDIYGDGRSEYEQMLQKKIELLNAQDFITWYGKVPSAWKNIYQADGLLVCSQKEAFGRITVEGMLMETPVIGAASGGTKELIGENEERGYLFRPNDLNDLVHVLRRVMTNEKERRKKVHEAKEWAEDTFTRERYKDTVETVLRKI